MNDISNLEDIPDDEVLSLTQSQSEGSIYEPETEFEQQSGTQDSQVQVKST